MYVHPRLIIFLFLLLQVSARGQGLLYGPGYQSAMTGNPGITGSGGDGSLRLSYMNLYPGGAYNLHSAIVSYDGYFPALHGGAGVFVSNDYLGGIFNDLKAGVSYSYFFQADKNLWFSAGLTASVYHRGFNAGNAVLPDQIDPLAGPVLPSGESLASEGRTLFDLGTGFVFYSGKLSGGLAVNHLAEPGLSFNDPEGRLKRVLIIHLTGDFVAGNNKQAVIKPLGIIEMQQGYFSAAAGAAVTFSYISASSIFLTGNSGNLDLQAGLSVNAGIADIFYNYRFNILTGNNVLPFSLQHHTGVALRLLNVDKRKTIKTIKFPIL